MTRIQGKRERAALIGLCIVANAVLNLLLAHAGPIPGALVSTAAVLTITWLVATPPSPSRTKEDV